MTTDIEIIIHCQYIKKRQNYELHSGLQTNSKNNTLPINQRNTYVKQHTKILKSTWSVTGFKTLIVSGQV